MTPTGGWFCIVRTGTVCTCCVTGSRESSSAFFNGAFIKYGPSPLYFFRSNIIFIYILTVGCLAVEPSTNRRFTFSLKGKCGIVFKY